MVRLTEASTWTDARVIGVFASTIGGALLASLVLGGGSAKEEAVVAVLTGITATIFIARMLAPWPAQPARKILAVVLPFAGAEVLLWVLLRFVV